MRISVFGLGYVGSVSAACMARDGHHVVGVDVNPDKVDDINAGRATIIEPGLEELVRQGIERGSLRATVEARQAVIDSDISLVCVGTPSRGNGSLALHFLDSVCSDIGAALADHPGYHVVVIRSTVLPGTVEDRLIPLLESASGKKAGQDFGVVMNPEFLREGSAISDFYNATHTVIGEIDARSGDIVQEIYRAVEAPFVRIPIRTAEMVKYANNAFHAMKVVFANEIGVISKEHGLDGQEVMNIVCQDRRLNISPAYLRPGFAFGGSCLPKDLRALVYRAKERDIEVPMLNAMLQSNQRHIERGIRLVEETGRKRIGILGLSFKAGTDDVRESSVVPLIETLVGRGYQVGVYDEKVEIPRLIGSNKNFLEQELPHITTLMRSSMEEVVEAADIIVIANDTPEFRTVPMLMRSDQLLIDLVGAARTVPMMRGEYEGICW